MLDTSFHLFITSTTTTRRIFKESKRSKHVNLTVYKSVNLTQRLFISYNTEKISREHQAEIIYKLRQFRNCGIAISTDQHQSWVKCMGCGAKIEVNSLLQAMQEIHNHCTNHEIDPKFSHITSELMHEMLSLDLIRVITIEKRLLLL